MKKSLESIFPEVEIYKRKQESKKTRKHAFDQESDHETKKKGRKYVLDQESDPEKKILTSSISLS